MKLQPLVILKANLRLPFDDVGTTPFGHRMIAEVTGGTFEGERLNGVIVGPGADWGKLGNDGIGRLDVRLTLKTHDGALIYMQYVGKMEYNDKTKAAALQGKGMDLGDTYFMTQPRFETGNEDYVWLNRIVAIAEGRLIENGVEYTIFECTHD